MINNIISRKKDRDNKLTNKPKLTAISAAVLMVIAHSATAETEKPKENKRNNEIENITIFGHNYEGYLDSSVRSHKYAKDLVDTPKTINIINEELLKDQNADNLNDALRNVAGVSTFGAGEGGGGDITTNDKITIRGFDADSSIYIDDIRDIAGYSRDLFNVEAVEVTKGGNGSITGKGSSGGTVSLITKRAKDSNGGNVDFSVNSIDNVRAHLDYNAVLSETVSARINVLVSEGNDPLDNGVSDFDSYGLATAINWNISDATQAKVDLYALSQRSLPSLGLPFATESVANTSSLPFGPIDKSLWDNYYGISSRDFEDVDVYIATAILNHKFNDSFKIRALTRVANNDRESITGRPNFVNEGSRSDPNFSNLLVSTALVIEGLAYIDARDQEHDLLVTQVDGIIDFNTGNIEHNAVVGVEYYEEGLLRKDIDSSTVTLSSSSVTLINPDQNVTFSGRYQPLPNPAKVDGDGLVFYANDTMTYKKWQFSIGTRIENYDLSGSQYFTRRVDGQRVRTLETNLSSSVDLFTWNAGLVYKPSDNATIYLSAVNSEEPLGGNLRFVGRSATDLRRNTSIDPEDSVSYEIGTKWQLFNRQLLLTAAIFETQRTIIDSAGRGQPISLSGEQKSRGFEFSSTGKINDRLSVLLNYTHLDTEITETAQPDEGDLGNGLSAAPDDTASIWFNYLFNQKLSLGAGVQYSSGDVFFRRNRAFFDTGSYSIWNMSGAYRVSEKIKVQFNMNNIFNESYIIDFSARGHFRPGTPRNASISFNYRF